MRLCKCGKALKNKEKCKNCHVQTQANGTTTERGYGNDHKQASERWRTLHPVCECCLMSRSVIESNSSVEMHHIFSISSNREKRMHSDNWLAVCKSCHEALEGNEIEGIKVKRWSEQHYENKLNEGLE